MNYLKYLILLLILALPTSVYGGPPLTQSIVGVMGDKDRPDEDVYAYYDLRNRKTYVQITNVETEDSNALPTLCLHIQIFQQDRGCTELNFEDELTPNDTVIYDMDNLVRNDGTEVPVNLDDDSYGFVAVSAYACNDRSISDLDNPLIGNFRIIDDAGYEYRMNLLNDRDNRIITQPSEPVSSGKVLGNIIIPFNTADEAKFADVVGFIVEENRTLSGIEDGTTDDLVYNEEVGITFSVFQIDENEERISCDQKTIGCGPNVVLNYGINEDYPASRGNNLLCEGAGLTPGQTNG
ncbi:MAG: hypothetical protein GTO02_15425, partial [Candidatus Dadabacteria bacterium]|nr:hypothetical protein [Candidatus Dadabacteria bacterium]NIQ15731.1 hypothetical protein [Candidatus Dadabacteria bacterium]